MKKSILILIIYFLSNMQMFSQWSKIYGETDIRESNYDMVVLNDGYAILGRKEFKLLLIRTDLNGDTLWTKTYFNDINSIYKLSNNNANEFFVITNDVNTRKLLKIDNNGNLIWEREYRDNLDAIFSNDNSFIVLNQSEGNLMTLLKISETGDTSWIKHYFDESMYSTAADITLKQFNDSSLLIVASHDYPNYQLSVIKTDLNGDSLWYNSFPKVCSESVSVNITENGYYLFGSSSRGYKGLEGNSYLIEMDLLGNKIQEEYSERYLYTSFKTNDGGIIKTDFSNVIKTDENHNIQWERNLISELNFVYSPIVLSETSDNGFIIKGFCIERGGFIILKIDSLGNLIWNIPLSDKLISYYSHGMVKFLSSNQFVLLGDYFAKGEDSDISLLNLNTPTKVELSYYPVFNTDSKTNETQQLFSDTINVKILSNIFDATIYYTIDGSTPNTQSSIYEGPIKIHTNTTIRAIGISSDYENSDVVTKEYQFYQKFNLELENEYFGIDSNFVGSANVSIAIPNPEVSLGEVTLLEWIFNGKVIAEGNNVNFEFPTGTNKLVIKTTGSWGTIQYDTTEVNIISSSYISSYYSNSNTDKAIYPKHEFSQFPNGKYIFTDIINEYLSLNVVLFDSTCNVNWQTLNVSNISTPCIIDNKDFIGAMYLGRSVFEFVDTSSSNEYYRKIAFTFSTNERISTSASYLDSLVFFGTISGKVNCSHLSDTRSSLWTYECGDTITTDIVITDTKDLVFGCANEYLYSISLLGNLNWKLLVNSSIKSTPALGTDSSIVFGTESGFLYKVSKNGSELWKYKTDGKISNSPVIDFYGNIYVASSDGFFYSLNSSGELNWKFECLSGKESYASIGNNGLIYLNTGSNILYVLDKSGNIKWYYKFNAKYVRDIWGNNIYESISKYPLISDDYMVVIRTTFDNIRVLKENSENHLSEELPQWSTFKGSNQRTGMRYYDPGTSINEIDNNIPKLYSMLQNYPNPFNPSTTIKYDIPKDGNVELEVFNILGERVKTLVNEYQKSGSYSVQFDAKNISSGIYFYRLKSGEFIKSMKLILLK